MGCLSKSFPFVILGLLVLLFSCERKSTNEKGNDIIIKDNIQTLNQIYKDTFQSILDSNNLMGSILIYDSKQQKYYSNDFERAKTGFLPASTFKIINSIIGLETGIIEDENHLFKWDGTPRRLKRWEADLTLAAAYQKSCVPCYQSLARNIGIDTMNYYLKKLDYGNQVIADSLIDLFWLVGDFKVSQFNQINFLHRLYNKALPISKKTYKVMRKVMLIEETEDYTLSGKTGWAVRDNNNIGWFVGFFEYSDNTYFISTNITPKNEIGLENFAQVRLEVSLTALKSVLW